MEIIEQTAYVEGSTENCKDLITKSNRILAEMGTDKVLKMRRGIEQEFVDVVVEGKRLSEDWEDTKTIFSITFYDMLNKYLFDKEVQGVFVKHEDFVKTTMQNTKYEGDDASITSDKFFQVAQKLNEQYGLGIFYTGITPILLKAIILHGTEFWIYDFIVRSCNNMLVRY